MTEHAEQCALVEWAAANEARFPELCLLYAVPNGGHRHKATALKMRAEGVRPGVPDLHLPVSRGGYLGLWIEMKIKGNRPTEHQAHFMQMLDQQGHLTRVCYGADEAIQALQEYLNNADYDEL